MSIATRTHSQHNRRGVAMLLVIVSLAMATILSVAYLASRDNSSAVGMNVSSAAAARWGADTGIDMGIAIMQTEKDWRTAHVDGKLLDDYPLPDGTLDLDILDLETGAPPDADADLIELTSTATVNGVEQKMRTIASIGDSLVIPPPVKLDLSEFVVFGREQILLGDQTTIALWSNAPANMMGGKIALGTRATTMGKINLSNEAAAIDATVFHLQSASASLVMNNNPNSPAIRKTGMQDAIPIPMSPSPPAASGTWGGDLEVKSTTQTIGANTVFGTLRLDSGTLSINGDVTIYATQRIELDQGSGIVIDGNAKFVSDDDFRMIDSYIELTPGSSLELYVGDALEMQRSYIGDVRADQSVRDNSGKASYINPALLKIFGVDPNLRGDWQFKLNSVVKGSIYVPYSSVSIEDDSALYGRLATNGLQMTGEAAIFYDQSLDGGHGFTNPDSTAYDGSGRIRPQIKSLASLNSTTLSLLSTVLGVPIESNDALHGSYNLPLLGILPLPELPGQATPRPIDVEHFITAVGAEVDAMESHAQLVAAAPDSASVRKTLTAVDGMLSDVPGHGGAGGGGGGEDD